MVTSDTLRVVRSLDPPSLLADYIARDALAKELGKSPRTVARLFAAGDVPPYLKIGNKYYFRRDAVAEWLRSREINGRRRGRTAK